MTLEISTTQRLRRRNTTQQSQASGLKCFRQCSSSNTAGTLEQTFCNSKTILTFHAAVLKVPEVTAIECVTSIAVTTEWKSSRCLLGLATHICV